MKTDKILSSKYSVRFQDSDPFRHLNNARYLDYFVNAREDQFDERFGIKTGELAFTEGIGWVVSSNFISYLVPANVNETVLIETQLVDYGNKHLFIEMKMWDENKTQLKALNWVELVHFDIKTARPVNHKDDLMVVFESMKLPLDTSDFKNRSMFYMQFNKESKKFKTSV